MADIIITTLLAVSLILFFGFFAEFTFRKTGIPDVLFLIILGFVIGPNVLNYVTPEQLTSVAPVFTTFTLLFLLFDGAFNINLSSLIKEFSHSFILTIYNFAISSVAIAGVMVLWGFPFSISLLTGFALGGISSAFVIPVLKGMDVKGKLYSLLTLESALTDVFCIVFSLTVFKVMELGGFGLQNTFAQISSLFAVAGLIGILGAVIWIILVLKVFKEHNYMMTIAYLILIYVVTGYLGGNGAIAAMFFGLILNNSKQLSSIIKGITVRESAKKKRKQNIVGGDLGVSITTPSEEFFYHQISFFLKTFFFVYVGILIDLSDTRALIIGGIISFVILATRYTSSLLTHHYPEWDRKLVNVIFARGLAAAAIAQIAIINGVSYATVIAKVIYIVITGSILLSSISIFFVKKFKPVKNKKKCFEKS